MKRDFLYHPGFQRPAVQINDHDGRLVKRLRRSHANSAGTLKAKALLKRLEANRGISNADTP